MSDPRRVAQDWLADDPDPETRAATAALLDAGDEDALADCFASRLHFGTAGLRGALGPGPNRMNRALVRRVSAGLADWVLAHRAGNGPVVVGFDGRRGSATFAADTAAVLAGRGLEVVLFDGVCPTPLLAYAVRHLHARAGVMVTASHNPPSDNGYKVYDSDGGQIVSPVDNEISACIDRIEGLASVEVPSHEAMRVVGRLRTVPAEVRRSYVEAVLGLRVHPEVASGSGGPRIVYTPLHGVGRDLLVEVLERAGYDDLHVVTEQAEPDGAFPTVAFPNPEEPGALDLALALGDEVGADLIIANDPDADRLAVVVGTDDGWHRLTGNDVGVILAEDLLQHGEGGERMVATTLVSSSLLSRIARSHGCAYAETLTGFKWIARAARDFDGPLVLGFEEALGYSVGGLVRDKDGVSAALILCDLASWLATRGETLLDALAALQRRYGVHASGQRATVLDGADGKARMAAAMEALRADPPEALDGTAVVAVRDVLAGTLPLPRSDVLGFDLDGGHRVHVRPSGTEPKLKIYAEAVQPVGPDDLEAARRRAAAKVDALLEATARRAGLTPAGG